MTWRPSVATMSSGRDPAASVAGHHQLLRRAGGDAVDRVGQRELALRALGEGGDRGLDEVVEERVRPGRAAPELGVELASDEERVASQLHVLYQVAGFRDAARHETALGEPLAVLVVDLEPVPVALVDLTVVVCLAGA